MVASLVPVEDRGFSTWLIPVFQENKRNVTLSRSLPAKCLHYMCKYGLSNAHLWVFDVPPQACTQRVTLNHYGPRWSLIMVPTTLALQVCVWQVVDSVRLWEIRHRQAHTCIPMMQHLWGPPSEHRGAAESNKAARRMIYYFSPVRLISLSITLLWQADDVVQGSIQIHEKKPAWQRPSGIPSLFRATPRPSG